MLLHMFFTNLFYSNQIRCIQREKNIFLCFELFETAVDRETFFKFIVENCLPFSLHDFYEKDNITLNEATDMEVVLKESVKNLCKKLFDLIVECFEKNIAYKFSKLENLSQEKKASEVSCANDLFQETDFRFLRLFELLRSELVSRKSCSLDEFYKKIHRDAYFIVELLFDYVTSVFRMEIDKLDTFLFEKLINVLYYALYFAPESGITNLLSDSEEEAFKSLNGINYLDIKFFFIPYQEYLQKERVVSQINKIYDYIQEEEITEFNFYIMNNFKGFHFNLCHELAMKFSKTNDIKLSTLTNHFEKNQVEKLRNMNAMIKWIEKNYNFENNQEEEPQNIDAMIKWIETNCFENNQVEKPQNIDAMIELIKMNYFENNQVEKPQNMNAMIELTKTEYNFENNQVEKPQNMNAMIELIKTDYNFENNQVKKPQNMKAMIELIKTNYNKIKQKEKPQNIDAMIKWINTNHLSETSEAKFFTSIKIETENFESDLKILVETFLKKWNDINEKASNKLKFNAYFFNNVDGRYFYSDSTTVDAKDILNYHYRNIMGNDFLKVMQDHFVELCKKLNKKE